MGLGKMQHGLATNTILLEPYHAVNMPTDGGLLLSFGYLVSMFLFVRIAVCILRVKNKAGIGKVIHKLLADSNQSGWPTCNKLLNINLFRTAYDVLQLYPKSITCLFGWECPPPCAATYGCAGLIPVTRECIILSIPA